MNFIKLIIIFAFLSFLLSCSTNRVTFYKNKNALPKSHDKIMVVSILPDTSLASAIDNYYLSSLNNLGYNTTTGVEEFGRGIAAKLNDEQTYIKLNKKGIDALLIVVVLEEKYKANLDASRLIKDPGTFYYQRIADYYKKKLAQSLAEYNQHVQTKVFMESVFIDLSTLEPLFSINTKLFSSGSPILAQEKSKMIINKMLKLKVLKKRKTHATVQFKPL